MFLSVLGRALVEVVWGWLGDASHKESPLCPTPVKTGWVLASRNPVAMDTVVTALLGFDFRRIPQVAKPYELRNYPLVLFRPEDVEVVGLPGVSTVGDIYVSRSFVSADPSRGWKGHAEYVPEGDVQ